ncbi:MAG: hypothetical protein BGN87_08135 [Rhizobiales bacterium 65-79]|jgi:hypothetical protein|nr:MAPEG family protein [Hyphomicrobiales bacterium]OJU04527.1 MAG: hypothetical protein BGN87_08135 [Rhizobiales bacterium 65-79]
MNQTAIFWPVIAQVFLVYLVYGLLGLRRRAAVQAGSASRSGFRENRNEPRESLFVHNNLLNQFQLPVLFYVVCLCLYVTQGNSLVTVVLAWIFVVSRYLHAAIHVTSNDMRYRPLAFTLGYVVLFILWLWFALHLLAVV